MNKDIYVIKNDINNKIYIRQAKNTKERFAKHTVPSAAMRSNSLVDKAIQKYGKEHFWYEILEDQIENYNEREQYWIKKLNCKYPYGYNLTDGGEEPPLMRGTTHIEAILTEDEVVQLTDLLKNTNISFVNLAAQFGFASNTSISDFNKGKTYYRNSISYPIREKVNNGKLTYDDIEQIYDLLLHTKKTFKSIGELFGVEGRAISRINKGIFHKKDGYTYPLRSKK